MNVKERIMHYITLYAGSEKRIIRHAADDLLMENGQKNSCEDIVRKNLFWLTKNGYIYSVSFNEMTEDEKRYYNSDSCTIYRIRRRYDEAEYLREKNYKDN